MDTVVGLGLIPVARIAENRVDDRYLTATLLTLTRALGYDSTRAAAILSEPLALLEFDADTLLVRTHARFKKPKRPKVASVRRHVGE